MKRRGFFALLAAPFIARLLPAAPVSTPSVAERYLAAYRHGVGSYVPSDEIIMRAFTEKTVLSSTRFLEAHVNVTPELFVDFYGRPYR